MDLDEIANVTRHVPLHVMTLILEKLSEVLAASGQLSQQDKVEIIERLRIDLLGQTAGGRRKTHSFSDWLGAGSALWQATDIDAYIKDLRDSWHK